METKYQGKYHWVALVLIALIVAIALTTYISGNKPASKHSDAATTINPSAPQFVMPFSPESPGSTLGTTNAISIGIGATDREGGVLNFSFSWGDKSPADTASKKAQAGVQTSATFTHQYRTAGNYTLTVSVSDGQYTTTKIGQVKVISPLSHPVVNIELGTHSVPTDGQHNVLLLPVKLSASNGNAQIRTFGIAVETTADLQKFTNLRLVDENGQIAAAVVEPTLRNPGYNFNLNVPLTLISGASKNLSFIADINPLATGTLQTRLGEWLITDSTGLPIGPNVNQIGDIKRTITLNP